jgi:hypothetical protein
MKRRLYFLFPDPQKAHRVVGELTRAGIDRARMHALAADGVDLSGLPAANVEQRTDLGARIERVLWGANLAFFGVALLVFVGTLLAGMSAWSVVAVAVMLTTFLVGASFAVRVPNVHLDEFRDALAHRGVLLMVDVPRARVPEVEDRVHRHHPEATVGGVGWTAEILRV